MEEMREAVDRLRRRQKQVDAQVRHLTDNLNKEDFNVVHAPQEQIDVLRRTTCEMTNVSRAFLYPNANVCLSCFIVMLIKTILIFNLRIKKMTNVREPLR